MTGSALETRTGHKRTARALTWTCLAAIPALAVLTLGSGLVPALGTSTGVPSGAQVAETRALTITGDDLAAAAPASATQNVDEFTSNWQNTVRRRPSPRR